VVRAPGARPDATATLAAVLLVDEIEELEPDEEEPVLEDDDESLPLDDDEPWSE
jgi:hypothetical protein